VSKAENMKTFAERLDTLRKPGETKREFACRIGISPVQLSRYYSGVSPGRKVLERISRRTGASMDWLFYGEPGERSRAPKRVGASTSKKLSDEDLLNLACDYLNELKQVDKDGREAIKEILTDIVENPGHREKMSSFLGFIKFESRGKKRK